MKLKNINHARNVFDRAVAILPRVDQFWYKYIYMEEMLDNVSGARQIYERWMLWEPKDETWLAFVQFEQRYKETARAQIIYQRFVNCHPAPKNWIKWSKFEENLGNIGMFCVFSQQLCVEKARQIYEECSETLGQHFVDQNIFVSFAKFEVRQKEFERARCIFKYALDILPKGRSENLYNSYTQFEKQYGGREGIEDVVSTKRRLKYEEEIQANSRNYDVWFDYARLEENVGDFQLVREVYERALAQVPLLDEKRYWRRYIYIWLFYAIWEESVAKVYKK
jgi:crooked neck